MKAVMYHYVRPTESLFPQYYHLALDDFRNQLSYFQERYGFVERDRFLKSVRNDSNPPSGVVLTFDDGLIDHHEFVLPELQRRGLWGIFYVPTGPYQSGQVLDVHRIHALLGQFGGGAVLGELLDTVSIEQVDDDLVDRFESFAYRNQTESAATKVKRILNYYLPVEQRKSVLDDLIDRMPDAKADTSDFYMSIDQVRSLAKAGMVVGSHSVTHRVLSKLQLEMQREEIVSSFKYLQEELGELKPRTFCYPYGGDRTFTGETVRLLIAAECEFAFSVESRDVSAEDLAQNEQALPRYDCNEFRHGDASGGLG